MWNLWPRREISQINTCCFFNVRHELRFGLWGTNFCFVLFCFWITEATAFHDWFSWNTYHQLSSFSLTRKHWQLVVDLAYLSMSSTHSAWSWVEMEAALECTLEFLCHVLGFHFSIHWICFCLSNLWRVTLKCILKCWGDMLVWWHKACWKDRELWEHCHPRHNLLMKKEKELAVIWTFQKALGMAFWAACTFCSSKDACQCGKQYFVCG